MNDLEERTLRLKKLMYLNHEIDEMIFESMSDKDLLSFGMLLMVRGLRILSTSYGSAKIKQLSSETIDEYLSKSNSYPRGWNSDRQEWDVSAFLNQDDPDVRS